MNWKEKIPNNILATMRYVYPDEKNCYCGKIDEEEWLGKEDESGVKDYIISLILDEIKRGFFMGFSKGAKRTYEDLAMILPKEDFLGAVFSEEENKGGAWKAWEEWNKEMEEK